MRLIIICPFALVVLTALSGCGLFSKDQSKPETQAKPQKSQRLSEVYFAPLPLDHTPLEEPETESMRDAYRDLLAKVTDESQTKKIVQYRLADLEVNLAEQKLEEGAALTQSVANEQQLLFGLAIAQYQQVLAEHPDNPENYQVLYQLAKAFEQQGQINQSFATLEQLILAFPDNPYLAESYFRLGEIEFNRANYIEAIKAYKQVLTVGTNPYYGTAAYMLGWSYFNNKQPQQALTAFTTLLDYKLPNEIVAQSMLTQVDSQSQIASLAIGEKRLINDTIRIMSLLFSYQDANYAQVSQSIIQHFNSVGQRHYEYVLYDALAQHYLNNDRYRDSAKVYQTFADIHPQHFQAPIFAVKQIDAYILGKFPSLVLPSKQTFVLRYGIEGDFWPNWPVVLQESVAPYLNQYLQELAQFEHSRGQQLMQTVQSIAPNNQDSTGNQPSELKEQAKQALMLAANWYQQFILTFPKDAQTPELTYRMGEALFDAKQYPEAIAAFESYAYQHKQLNSDYPQAHPKAADAAYNAILAYTELQLFSIEGDTKPPLTWLDKQLIAQENFVASFSADPRAVDILHNSVQQLFSLKRHVLAINAAQQLLNWQPAVSSEKRLASYLVIGHSQFALQQFALAETTYEQVLQLLTKTDDRYADMRDRLAASIYQQGEQNVANNYLPLAVNDFLRVIAKTPESTIRINAQYDAATYLLQMQEWQQSIELFEDFKQRFPKHTLTSGIQQKLIVAYQQNQNWLKAAEELIRLHQSNPQSDEGRQALYVAAQYFQKLDNIPQALDTFRTYAHSYPLPLAEANEARYTLSEFYLKSDEPNKRRFWLNKLIQADRQAQNSPNIERTLRSRYLAAMASNVFADDKLQQYKNIKLVQPLKSSLAKKKTALNNALDAYNQTLGYKIAEFTAAANFSIGDIYHQLAKDLMNSSRPNNLNALELEQYDLLLEEQAYPFEEQAIDIHQTNAKRSWQGDYDIWVQNSFSALKTLLPGRFNKQEKSPEVMNDIY